MSLVTDGADLSRHPQVVADHVLAGTVLAAPEPSLAEVKDYVALMKPRVMSLVVFTALVGMLVAPDRLHPVIGFAALVAIAVGAGAAGALNMWWDADIDRVMSRTARRPIPAGRVRPEEALAFGATLAVGSVAVLGLVAGWLAAGLLAFTILFYAIVYSMWLKRATSQNIVIGGAAGAVPPMIGWAAATGSLSLEPVLLFLIIFFWTPPHFWALSLWRSDDYARAGIPMLPVVSGVAETKRQILLHALLLAPVGVSPALFGGAGILYGLVATYAGAKIVWLSVRLWRAADPQATDRLAKRLFGFSLYYLFALFAVLLVDRWVAPLIAAGASALGIAEIGPGWLGGAA
ncbi:heme o synthase [Rhodoplanes sp. SY1]|uniref:heme o synthase n=1 Tax=Rhodoplanes sp. SY1 TaxID=3166646 RepID=UPI0038B5C1A8